LAGIEHEKARKQTMADQNDLQKPDGTSSYQTEVWQTLRGHLARLWAGDYTGMANLVAGMRRWINLGGGNVKLVERNSAGGEDTLFDSSVLQASLKNSINDTAAIANNALPKSGGTVTGALAVKGTVSARSPNNGTSGTVRLVDAENNPNAIYLQATNNEETVQYSYLRFMPQGYVGLPRSPESDNNSTDIATTAFVQNSTLGNGQTWQDMTADRGPIGSFYNLTGRPIVVVVQKVISAQGFLIITCSRSYGRDPVADVVFNADTRNMNLTVSLIVPHGSYYFANWNSGGSYLYWMELR
jgi:hypothetical protein